MRTTINIDEDVLRQLKHEARRSRRSLTETVNRILQLGMDRAHPAPNREPYVSPTFSMGSPAADLDKALRLAARLEDDETLGELERRR